MGKEQYSGKRMCVLRFVLACEQALWGALAAEREKKESLRLRLWNLNSTSNSLWLLVSLRSWRYCVVVEWDLTAESSRAAKPREIPPRPYSSFLGTRLRRQKFNLAPTQRRQLRRLAPRRLSCQISTNQREAETSANVNKHWKTRAKGNDVITNVISSIRRFWGKGERWKRKGERASPSPI